MRRFLTARGHGVEWAKSGEEALALVERSAFDLLLTDLAMPRMNGVELIRSVRARGLRLPIITMSGSLFVEEVPPDVRGEIHAWLSKPFPLEALARALATALPRTPG